MGELHTGYGEQYDRLINSDRPLTEDEIRLLIVLGRRQHSTLDRYDVMEILRNLVWPVVERLEARVQRLEREVERLRLR